jgi:hypothetical protein
MEEMSGPTDQENALFGLAQVSASYFTGDGSVKQGARQHWLSKSYHQVVIGNLYYRQLKFQVKGL